LLLLLLLLLPKLTRFASKPGGVRPGFFFFEVLSQRIPRQVIIIVDKRSQKFQHCPQHKQTFGHNRLSLPSSIDCHKFLFPHGGKVSYYWAQNFLSTGCDRYTSGQARQATIPDSDIAVVGDCTYHYSY